MVAPQVLSNSSGHIVYSEILSVTSIMRKHSRWSSSTQAFYTGDQVRDSAHTSLSHVGVRRPYTSSTAGPQQGHQDVVVFVLEFAGFLGVSLVTV